MDIKNELVKRDFGSFISSNAEELINLDDSIYRSPKLDITFELDNYTKLNLSSLFGTNELKKVLFYLTDEFHFLNHGAFGLSFKPVVEYVNKWRAYSESQPLRFYDRQAIPFLIDIIRLYSKKVFFCQPTELVLVDNCTFAFNSVVKSIKFNPGDKFLIFSTTYGVYKKILKAKCEASQAILIEIQIQFPIIDEKDLNEKFVNKLDEVLKEDEKDKKIKYIMVDHVPSNQPFIIPIESLSNLCKTKRQDILFIVDAAHSLGSIKDFSLKNLNNVDILFTNCHKWFCGPKGTAFLFKNKNINSNIFNLKPAIESHGINSGFNSEFVWSGLKDYSAYLGLYATLNIWLDCLGGLNNAIDYSTKLAKKASEYLVNAWATSYLVNPDLCSTMVCVRLPDAFINKINKLSEKLTYDQAEKVQNFLYFNYNIEVPIKCIQDKLYIRISSHIYNNLNEYIHLADCILENC